MGKIHLFAEHDCKVQSVGEVVIADAASPDNDLSGPLHRPPGSALQRADGIDIVFIRPAQIFESFEQLPYSFNPISFPAWNILPLHYLRSGSRDFTSGTRQRCVPAITCPAPPTANPVRGLPAVRQHRQRSTMQQMNSLLWIGNASHC